MAELQVQVGPTFFAEMAARVRKSPGEIVMIVRRPGGMVLLMTKYFYPEGIYRLPTGKLKRHELPEEAFGRELFEETGFRADSPELIGVVHYAISNGGEVVDYPSHVYATEEIPGIPESIDGDEGITGFREVTADQLLETAHILETLPEPWRDWGRWRALVHRYVHDQLTT